MSTRDTNVLDTWMCSTRTNKGEGVSAAYFIETIPATAGGSSTQTFSDSLWHSGFSSSEMKPGFWND